VIARTLAVAIASTASSVRRCRPASVNDPITGDSVPALAPLLSYAAMAGYPSVSVPNGVISVCRSGSASSTRLYDERFVANASRRCNWHHRNSDRR
jgi:hypothetical protein